MNGVKSEVVAGDCKHGAKHNVLRFFFNCELTKAATIVATWQHDTGPLTAIMHSTGTQTRSGTRLLPPPLTKLMAAR